MESIKLIPIQSSPVDIISNQRSFEITEMNLNIMADKINELILILNGDSIPEARKVGRPKKEI